MADYFERGDERGPAIPYPRLAETLFPKSATAGQRLVPFLGSGASTMRMPQPSDDAVTFPDPSIIERVCAELGFEGAAKRFIELAIRLAARVAASETSGRIDPDVDPFQAACNSKYPPSASELAAALAYRSGYDGFERPRRRVRHFLSAKDSEIVQVLRYLADLTEIGPSVPPLVPVASYYEYTLPRQDLWSDLETIFANKRTPAHTHWLVARVAEHYLQLQPKNHYLIITTNYDRLMESALESARLPYCVLAVRNADQYVEATFPPYLRDYLGLSESEFAELGQREVYPKFFTLEELRRPLVVLYKQHGSLAGADRDSVIVSEEDYIQYLMRMRSGEGVVPGAITSMLDKVAFLFLGYSFNDWNVRAMYKSVRSGARRNDLHDYAVVRELNSYESAFVRETNARIDRLMTDLSRFARNILKHAPKRRRMGS